MVMGAGSYEPRRAYLGSHTMLALAAPLPIHVRRLIDGSFSPDTPDTPPRPSASLAAEINEARGTARVHVPPRSLCVRPSSRPRPPPKIASIARAAALRVGPRCDSASWRRARDSNWISAAASGSVAGVGAHSCNSSHRHRRRAVPLCASRRRARRGFAPLSQ